MPAEELDEMLSVSKRIAEAVEAYPPEVRQAAYTDLMTAWRGGSVMGAQPAEPSAESRDDRATHVDESPGSNSPRSRAKAARPVKAAKATKVAGQRRATTKKQFTPDRHIDFWPSGKQSWEELIKAKEPATIDQKNLVAVYWFEQVCGLSEIGTSQVLAAYKAADWPEPSQPDNSLQATASREHWLDTKNMAEIRTTPTGRNVVDHRMPLPKKGKK